MLSPRQQWDKSILITGGAGFIASHVVILLAQRYPNYKIVNYDKLDYCSSLKNLESVASLPNYTFVKVRRGLSKRVAGAGDGCVHFINARQL